MSDAAEVISTQGIVIYSDGGSRNPFSPISNPGYGGYGIHGYLYKTDKPKKGIGVPGMTVTAEGYKMKVDTEQGVLCEEDQDLLTQGMTPEAREAHLKEYLQPKYNAVTPIHYIDGFGALGPNVSNNYGELLGAVRALQHAAQFDVKQVHLLSDSEYVVKGMNQNVAKWINANWLQPDGQPRKNADTWKDLVACRDVLTQRGVEVRFEWIESHNGMMGNVQADSLATVGVLRSIAGRQEEQLDQTPADGYWSYDAARHPLLFQRRVYFNTSVAAKKAGEYYTGDHGKDDDSAGTRVSDGCYAVVRIKEPDSVIEKVRDAQIAICGGMDHVAFIRVDNLFRPETHKQIVAHGLYGMEKKNLNKDDLFCLDREPLTKVLNPARLSSRVIEELSALDEKLVWFHQDDTRLVKTDMTAILYETVVKTPKNGEAITQKVLKEQYNVGYAALRLDANYKSVDGTVQAVPVTLNLGIDMPDRNALKRLESLDPVVTLVSWKESDYLFRYAVVVETNSGVGIYAGVYSNIRIVEKDTATA